MGVGDPLRPKERGQPTAEVGARTQYGKKGHLDAQAQGRYRRRNDRYGDLFNL